MNFCKKKWTISPVDNISDEEYLNLRDLSVRIRDYITDQFKDRDTGELPEDFLWLRGIATRPAFHHLCFVYKATAYSCIIGSVVDNQILVPNPDWDNFQRDTKKFGLQACIIPLKEDNTSIEVQPCLDANTLKPIDFKKEHLNDPLSEWELYCIGVNQVVMYLLDNNATGIEYCDIPDIKPSIWFTDSDGNKSYVLVRSVPSGLDSEPYKVNKTMMEKYKEQGIKGYFANIRWANLDGNNGDFMDKQVRHHSLVNTKVVLEPIGDVEKNHPSITIVDEKLYDVKL